MLPPLVTLVAQGEIICCWRSARVKSVSPGSLADPRVGERLGAGQVVDALGRRGSPWSSGRSRRSACPERPLDVDVDPADRVDHRDEPREVDPRVVLDRDAEQGADRVLERPHARPSGTLGWRSANDMQRVELRARRRRRCPSGTLTMSRGTDTIETVWPTGSSEATIIVSVSDAVRSGSLSTPTQQDVDPLAVLGPGRRGRARPRWTPPGRSRANVSPMIVP